MFLHNRRRRTRTSIPGLERLESRWTPAITLNQFGAELVIVGDATAQALEVGDLGNGTIRVFDHAAPNFNTRTFQGVNTVFITFNAGDDALAYLFGADVQAGNQVRVVVDGGVGRDRLGVGVLSASPLLMQAGSVREFEIAGGNGRDLIQIELADDLTIGNNATFDVLAQEGGGPDRLIASHRAAVNGTLKVDLQGGNGADLAFLDIQPAGNSNGNLALTANGGNGSDTLVCAIQAVPSTLTVDALQLIGGPGLDRGIRGRRVSAIEIETLDDLFFS